jgi:hypothetical protein
MTTAGPNSPSAITQYAPFFAGAGAWTGTLSDVFASDGAYVSSPFLDVAAFPGSNASDFLRIGGFGFILPDGATDISVAVEIQAVRTSGVDDIIFSAWAGLASAGNESDRLGEFGNSASATEAETYLTCSGDFLTKDAITSPAFFIDLQAGVFGHEGTETGSVDINHVRVAIEYTEEGGAGGRVKVWDGSDWVERPVKVWDGSDWVAA